MGKLHELLAVEGDLKGKANRVLTETLNTFKNKGGHFDSLHRVFKPDQEDQLIQPEETKPMTETVRSKLDYTTLALSSFIDAILQKETTNTLARADFILPNGTVVAKDVPATVLLALENKLAEYKTIYEAIPTLDPSEEWTWDAQEGSWKTETAKVRSKKTLRNHIVSPATDKHPANVQVFSEDVRIGLVQETKHSSKFTPAAKSEVLGRIDIMVQSAKKARQRANNTEVSVGAIGGRIFGFVHTGELSETVN